MYWVRIVANIQLSGEYEAANATEAIDAARRELRVAGELSDVTSIAGASGCDDVMTYSLYEGKPAKRKRRP